MKTPEPFGDAPHPGTFIRDEMEARGWLQRDLAYVLGSTEQAINLLLSGKRGVSPEMAKALAEAFSVAPELFMNLQRAYDLAQAGNPEPGIARRARLQAYPVREMIRRRWLRDGTVDELEAEMARFFDAANSNEIPHIAHAAKKTHYAETPAAQVAWLFRVRQIAKSLRGRKYSEKALREALPRLRALMTDPESVQLVPEILTASGVRLVVVESLPSAKIDGACLWLDTSAPVIGLSLRHDRIDNFWFVLRHEIEHVLNGDGMDREIIDVDLEGAGSDGTTLPRYERVANEAAAAFSVPPAVMSAFITQKAPFFSERDILSLAAQHKVHPGIVIGQIQKRTERWSLLRKHLVKVRDHLLPAATVDGFGVVARIKP